MKKILNALISSVLFIFVLFIVLMGFGIALMFYALSDWGLWKDMKSFYIVNASEEVFNVELLWGDELLLEKSILPHSEYIFFKELYWECSYKITCSVGENAPEVLLKAHSFMIEDFYILLTSKNEVVFEEISYKLED